MPVRPSVPIKQNYPVLRKAAELFEASGKGGMTISREAGLYEDFIWKLRSGQTTPNTVNLDSALRVIGYRLEIVPINPKSDQEIKP